jgi:ubiquinone/menaquinone biosynthesis C-methylase UbiE
MLRALYHLRHSLPQRIEQALARGWYEYLARMAQEAHMCLMNYGWADLGPQAKPIPLRAEDEPNRYCIHLYHHVVEAVDLGGLNVLEVGSGRGGGASYMARYLKPRSMVGLDITGAAIRFCNQHYHIPNLSFVQGDAESLPFDDGSFDAVVSVESSHCYRAMERFLHGVYRVLRPNGYFLFADHRAKEQVEALRTQICQTGFALRREQRITPNVLRALDLDNARKQQLIQQKVPRILQGIFNEFAGMKGTRGVYAQFVSGDKEYLSFVCRKPSARTT